MKETDQRCRECGGNIVKEQNTNCEAAHIEMTRLFCMLCGRDFIPEPKPKKYAA